MPALLAQRRRSAAVVCSTAKVIKGTRLSVDFFLGLIAQGWPEDEILRNYRLTKEQVRACVAYAQHRLSEEKLFPVAA